MQRPRRITATISLAFPVDSEEAMTLLATLAKMVKQMDSSFDIPPDVAKRLDEETRHDLGVMPVPTGVDDDRLLLHRKATQEANPSTGGWPPMIEDIYALLEVYRKCGGNIKATADSIHRGQDFVYRRVNWAKKMGLLEEAEPAHQRA